MSTTSLSPDGWCREDTLLPQAGPLVCPASGFASEKHVGVSASSVVVSLWAHPWARASLLQRTAAAWPRPHPAPAGRHCGSVLPPSATGWGSAFLRPGLQVVSGSSCLKHFLPGSSAHPISLLLFATPCSPSLFDTALPRRWQSHTSPLRDTFGSLFCTCTMQVIRHCQESCVSPGPSRAFAQCLPSTRPRPRATACCVLKAKSTIAFLI